MERLYVNAMDMLNNKINKLKRVEKTIKLLDKKYNNKNKFN